jgi:transcriptional regulator with XRE-family HTH domain
VISLLERERRRKGLTAAVLATRMGASPSTISQIERGRLAPTAELKKRAATALGVSVDALFPAFFVLCSRQPAGLLLVGVSGRVFAFGSKRRAEKAAKKAAAEVHGPLPIAHIALLLGVTEIEAAESLLVDPAASGARTSLDGGP